MAMCVYVLVLYTSMWMPGGFCVPFPFYPPYFGEGSEAELANLPRLVVSCRGLLSPLSRAEMRDTYPLLHHPHLLKWMLEI